MSTNLRGTARQEQDLESTGRNTNNFVPKPISTGVVTSHQIIHSLKPSILHTSFPLSLTLSLSLGALANSDLPMLPKPGLCSPRHFNSFIHIFLAVLRSSSASKGLSLHSSATSPGRQLCRLNYHGQQEHAIALLGAQDTTHTGSIGKGEQ